MLRSSKLLLLSLAANLVLFGGLAFLWHEGFGSRNQPGATTASVANSVQTAVKSTVPSESFAEAWARETQGDLHGLRDALRARGLPEYYINGLLAGAVMEKMRARIRENYPKAGPYWNASSEWTRTAVSRTYQTQRYNASMELLDLTGHMLEMLEMPVLGALYQRRVAWLSPAQQIGVQKIEMDYRQLAQMKPAQNFESLASVKQEQLLRQEREKDLRELLGETAFREYELRDSRATNLTQSQFKYLNVSEAQFREAAALNQRRLDQEQALNEARSYEERVQAKEALNRQEKQEKMELQRILGDGLYQDLQNSSKPEFTNIRDFARYHEIEGAQISAQSAAESSVAQRLDALKTQSLESSVEKKLVLQQLEADLRAATQANLGKDAEEYLVANNSKTWKRLQSELKKLDAATPEKGVTATP